MVREKMWMRESGSVFFDQCVKEYVNRWMLKWLSVVELGSVCVCACVRVCVVVYVYVFHLVDLPVC